MKSGNFLKADPNIKAFVEIGNHSQKTFQRKNWASQLILEGSSQQTIQWMIW
jgi:hypothetical protein